MPPAEPPSKIDAFSKKAPVEARIEQPRPIGITQKHAFVTTQIG
jgi:hypothetical protein